MVVAENAEDSEEENYESGDEDARESNNFNCNNKNRSHFNGKSDNTQIYADDKKETSFNKTKKDKKTTVKRSIIEKCDFQLKYLVNTDGKVMVEFLKTHNHPPEKNHKVCFMSIIMYYFLC